VNGANIQHQKCPLRVLRLCAKLSHLAVRAGGWVVKFGLHEDTKKEKVSSGSGMRVVLSYWLLLIGYKP
jgi:hypothetical protein